MFFTHIPELHFQFRKSTLRISMCIILFEAVPMDAFIYAHIFEDICQYFLTKSKLTYDEFIPKYYLDFRRKYMCRIKLF